MTSDDRETSVSRSPTHRISTAGNRRVHRSIRWRVYIISRSTITIRLYLHENMMTGKIRGGGGRGGDRWEEVRTVVQKMDSSVNWHSVQSSVWLSNYHKIFQTINFLVIWLLQAGSGFKTDNIVFWGKYEHKTTSHAVLPCWRTDTTANTICYALRPLCYKTGGRGFDTRWGEFLNLPNPSGRTRTWGLLGL
jgi:hypothetical protein